MARVLEGFSQDRLMIVESNSVETFREQNTVRQDEVSGDCSDQ